MAFMIKAIIFDMDGLLIDSEPIWFRAKQELMKTLNLEWTHEDQIATMGVPTQFWIDYLYKKVNGILTKDELLHGVTDRMINLYKKGEIELMPGVKEALKLAKENYKVGLATGSYKQLMEISLDINNWRNIFDVILSSDDLERGKPFPDIYLEVMKRLNVKPKESVVLEDSRDGIKAGVAAEANVIAIPSKEVEVPKDVLNSATFVIDSLNEFPEVLNKLNNKNES
ncbi:MAG: HAD family phosphatase [Ignavibacteriae bacterium]|nr:HAD family phosphatase [Ignavibacteriota bacterium]MCB9259123.1 HAD family phosphatase [Ignavibacteriales bacterium]